MTYNIAHRGYSAKFPENTLLAFKEALKTPCHGIELDLQLTKDGHVIVFHDEELGRTVNGQGFVKDYTLKELKGLDASYLFKTDYGFQEIPTLEEYFELVKDEPIFSVLELKNNVVAQEELEEKTIKIIKTYQLEKKVILCSFNPKSIEKCRVLAPEIKTAFLRDGFFSPSLRLTKLLKADFLSIRHQYLSPIWLPLLKRLPIPVLAWTVNQPRRLKRLARAKIYGIITNEPLLLSHLLEKQKARRR